MLFRNNIEFHTVAGAAVTISCRIAIDCRLLAVLSAKLIASESEQNQLIYTLYTSVAQFRSKEAIIYTLNAFCLFIFIYR